MSRVMAVIGLGYVGLPVAVEFAKKYKTVGFDLNVGRIRDLKEGNDRNGEVSKYELRNERLMLTSDKYDLVGANFYILAVPTPINDANRPDLRPLLSATEMIGSVLKKGDVVVFESTVYPGVTEEECIPVLEKVSGLKSAVDFKVGYSPERINPGDRERSFATIRKVVSGQDEEALGLISEVYSSVVKAGVFRAPSIKVAEAAKIVENTQRDLNIALMNELAMIFDRMGIDTRAVLESAATKWNFQKYVPGLVGGHCVGVDPYYLTHRAERMGYTPQLILAGRRINSSMGKFIAEKTIREMSRAGIDVSRANVTVLGLTFKENCRDTRNSRVVDIIALLRDFGLNVNVCDPLAYAEDADRECGVTLRSLAELPKADALVVAVAHEEFRSLGRDALQGLLKPVSVIIDVKGILPSEFSKGIRYWRF